MHKTHYLLENFCGASDPCHYVLYAANDSRGKLSRLAKKTAKTAKVSPLKVLPYAVTHAMGAINVLDVFCSCYTVISAVSQTYMVKLLYHVSDLLTRVCKCVNNLSATPHHTQIISLAILKLFRCSMLRLKRTL